MTTITHNQTERTVKIFDNFYNVELNINSSDFDIVFSFFQSVTNNDNIANNFTSSLFRISQETDINVLELLDQMRGVSNTLDLTKIMCYYLNTFRSNTALYGVGEVPRPNQFVARNVVQ